MATEDQDLTARPQDRWREYTIDQLESHAESSSQSVAGAMRIVLGLGTVVVVVLWVFDKPLIALAVAVLAVGLAMVPPAMSLAFQVKMGVGALGMLVEEVRALHVRLELSPKGPSDVSADDELDWDEDDAEPPEPREYGDGSATTDRRSTQM